MVTLWYNRVEKIKPFSLLRLGNDQHSNRLSQSNIPNCHHNHTLFKEIGQTCPEKAIGSLLSAVLSQRITGDTFPTTPQTQHTDVELERFFVGKLNCAVIL